MTNHPIDGLTPALTRRAILRALGFGAATAALTPSALGTRHSALAQGTPEADVPGPGSRKPGGPSFEDTAWDLAFDHQEIFRFVNEEVAYEAYPGALRGAKGTQWSFAGNSVDQALLLAELLTQAQVPVRFAAGELNDDAAGKLLESMNIDEAAARAQLEKVTAGGEMTLGDHPDLTPEQLAAIESPEALRQRLLELAATQLDDSLATLETALAAESITLPDLSLELPERERTQHVWVQFADGPEWVDLDPSIPGAEPGQTYATLTDTWDTLPEEIYHHVRFRAIVEKNSGGEAVREEVLVHDALAVDLVGVPVVLAHIPPSSIADLGVSITGQIEGTIQYIPTLLAGDAGETGTAVTFGAGEGGALDALGTSESDGEAIAEWLEIDIAPPDGRSTTVIREVFDRVGAAKRAAGEVDLASLPPVELVEDPQLGRVYMPMEAVWLMGVVGGRVPGTYFNQDYGVDDIEADMAVLVHGYHAARDWLQLEIAADRGYRWYHTEPNLTAAIVEPTEIAPGQYALTTSLDVIHQGYGILPFDGATPTVQPRVLAGVLAHVAERVGAEAAAELTPEEPPPAGSVAEVFAEAAKAGLEIRTLVPETADLGSIDVSDAARARIGDALSSGYVVVVPERAVTLGGVEQVGWWQVDPATGRTFDLMENGRGASPIGEDTVIIVGGPAWRAATAIKLLYFSIGIIVGFCATMAIITYPN